MQEKVTMTVPEFAKKVGISRSLAYKLVGEGKIPAIRLGEKRLIITKAAYDNWLDKASQW